MSAPSTPPKVTKRENPEWITQTREYCLITPLFGGGVEAGKVDLVTPIHGTGIRGQLRFWWRATRAGLFSTVEEMREAEGRIWGSATGEGQSGPSAVNVAVTMLDNGKPFKDSRGSTEIGHFRSEYSYVAFPLREQKGEVHEGIKFQLSLTYPQKYSDEIAATLWAWETFGGVGARVRRGFGAINLVSIDGKVVAKPLAARAQEALQQEYKMHVIAGGPTEVPRLVKHLFSTRTVFDDPLKAWMFVVEGLQTFRQQRKPGAAHNRPGRSKWPEPDAIRRMTGRASARHISPLSHVDKFPRAQFGLPIIFHFKDQGAGDPSQTSLQGVNEDRLASPLILRPFACANNTFVALAVVLRAPATPPGGLALEGAPSKPSVSSKVSKSEAAKIAALNGQPDVLLAFINHLLAKDK